MTIDRPAALRADAPKSDVDAPTSRVAALRPRVDTHAHVFHRGLATVPGARYAPAYDAFPEAYLRFLDGVGAARGVLVQPAFLGSDNSYLLACLEAAKGRLAGVTVVERPLGSEAAERKAAAGVVGVRFNLVGRTAAVIETPAGAAALRHAARFGWHVALHEEAAALPDAIAALGRFDGPIVIDHFGRPAAGDPDAALAALMARRNDRRLHVKLSAPYRSLAADAPALTARLLDAFGPERLVWGSDWPWTQFEDRGRARMSPQALGLDGPSLAALDATAMRLFFPNAA